MNGTKSKCFYKGTNKYCQNQTSEVTSSIYHTLLVYRHSVKHTQETHVQSVLLALNWFCKNWIAGTRYTSQKF